MGCGCKGKPSEPVKVTKGVITSKDVTPIQLPKIEEITKVKDYLRSKVKTEEGREHFHKFVLNNFGEVLGNYCDPVCMERQVKRIHELELKVLV